MKFTVLLVSVFLGILSLNPLYAANRAFAAERVIVSVIYSSDSEPYQQAWDGFKSFLTAKNVALWVSRYSLKEQTPETIATQIIAEKPDFIFALGTKAAKLAQASFNNVPIVFALVLEPEMIKASNVSGVLMDIPARLKLEYVKKIYGGKRNIGVIYSEKSLTAMTELQQACNDLGWSLTAKKINSGIEIPDALKTIRPQMNCFFMLPDAKIFIQQSVKYLLQESIKQKFPVVGLSRFYSKDGALISFDCDYLDLGQQAGEIALKIIDGAKASDITVAVPRKVKFSLNVTIAEKLALKIPADIQSEAAFIYGDEAK